MDAFPVDHQILANLRINRFSPCQVTSPLQNTNINFINDQATVKVYTSSEQLNPYLKSDQNETSPAFEMAGPRRKIFFSPGQTTVGIVTCGGLCPGLNDVIRSLTLTSIWQYGVRKVIGFRYGYAGLTASAPAEPIELTPDLVEDIHTVGGTILGAGRGSQQPAELVEQLISNQVDILFAIGGDGTIRGASSMVREITRRKLEIAVIGIPKTIDNDIIGVERSFGFQTAVELSREAIIGAHNEAKGAFNGIGLVKLMGRDSGFIAAMATLANSEVNFCLIPEAPLQLTGPAGFLATLETRLRHKHHAVIVVAEGFRPKGQDSAKEDATVPSGNLLQADIGLILKQQIADYCVARQLPASIKYIDPSYIIRSHTANSEDSAFCLRLGQHAVHAAMSGRTGMVISDWNQYFTHIPMELATIERKKIDPSGDLWQAILSASGAAVAPKHEKQARMHLLS